MEEYNDVMNRECNANFAMCINGNCESYVWNTKFAGKLHKCHGTTHADLVVHYEPIHKAQIDDMTKQVSKAHNDYAQTTNPNSTTSNAVSVPGPVSTLWAATIYPTYKNDSKPFDDEVDEIGGMDDDGDDGCLRMYSKAYQNCSNDSTVLSIDKSDSKAITKQLKKLHTEMNTSVRVKDSDSAGMVDAIKTIFSARLT